jgi:glycosyltransferase involved in cell wall biosynthesis
MLEPSLNHDMAESGKGAFAQEIGQVEKSDQLFEQHRPLVSLVAPAYNEALIIEKNLAVLCSYMESLEFQYRWELIIVNDGSRDKTGDLAEIFAQGRGNVYVIHHLTNFGLGQTLKTGFEHCQGDYIITLDLDLSYSPDNHIERLLSKIRETHAKIVVASPYMKGGKVSNVPWLRRWLSIWGNRFLSISDKGNLSTLTGMVRVYDADFLRTLNLRSMGMEINPEVIHKARLLEARVIEIPAHLKWSSQKAQPKSKRRKSSMKILKHTWAIFFFGFLFRPVMFFVIPSFLFFLISCYANIWTLIHCWTNYQNLAQQNSFSDPALAISASVSAAFQQAPHTFIIGGMSLMLATQLFSLGILSMQNKRYFEEIFYLGTAIYKSNRRKRSNRQ